MEAMGWLQSLSKPGGEYIERSCPGLLRTWKGMSVAALSFLAKLGFFRLEPIARG